MCSGERTWQWERYWLVIYFILLVRNSCSRGGGATEVVIYKNELICFYINQLHTMCDNLATGFVLGL